MKLRFLFAAAAAMILSACNGSSSSSPFFPSNTSYARVVNGSPDAGAVDVQIDGSIVQSNLAYGTMSAYSSLKVGSHTMNVFRAGNDSGKPVATSTFSLNAGQDTTVVLTGERHPSYGGKPNVALQVFNEQPYNTPSGGAAVNFHNASQIAGEDLHMTRVQFGYSLTATPANNALGTTQSYGGATGPVGLPSAALNTAITFYAKRHNSGYTITPGDAMAGCTGVPCNGQSNLSLYFIDGPAASTSPSTYPSYFRPHSKADFVGVFDGNGLVQ
jgi:hypothetical protein